MRGCYSPNHHEFDCRGKIRTCPSCRLATCDADGAADEADTAEPGICDDCAMGIRPGARVRFVVANFGLVHPEDLERFEHERGIYGETGELVRRHPVLALRRDGWWLARYRSRLGARDLFAPVVPAHFEVIP